MVNENRVRVSNRSIIAHGSWEGFSLINASIHTDLLMFKNKFGRLMPLWLSW
jgi:hypothetical protein